jgi:hypothetical protein
MCFIEKVKGLRENGKEVCWFVAAIVGNIDLPLFHLVETWLQVPTNTSSSAAPHLVRTLLCELFVRHEILLTRHVHDQARCIYITQIEV